MSEATKNKKSVYIHLAIMLILFIGIGYLPPFGEITPMGMKVLGVFIGSLYGWITIDFIFTSLLAFVFLGLSGYTSIMGAFGAGIANPTPLSMAAVFFLVGFLNEIGFTDALGKWILGRKILAGHPWRIVAAIMFTAYVLGVLNTIAAIFLVWSILYTQAEKLGFKKHTKVMCYLLLGVMIFSNYGAYFFPFMAASIMFSSTLVQGLNLVVPPGQWYFATTVTFFAVLLMYILLGLVLRVDLSAFKSGDHFEEFRSYVWSPQQKWGLFFLMFAFIFLIIPDFLPKNNVQAVWSSFGLLGVTVIVLTAGYFIRCEGKRLLENPGKTFSNNMMWDMFLMLAVSMAIADGLRAESTGIMTTVVSALFGLVGDMNWVLFTILCAIVFGLVTQVAHNVILAIALFPTFSQVVVQMGGDPILWFFVNIWTILAAFTTPAASVSGAILHGNTEWFSPAEAYKYGFSGLVVVWIACFAILIPVWLLVF